MLPTRSPALTKMRKARMMACDITTLNHDDLKARFWAKAIRRGPNECWPWCGTVLKKDNRGILYFDGRNHLAPRVSWFIHNGEWPAKGIFVCHACDNPNCVNPDHLWLGTCGDNTRDAAAKKRLWSQKPGYSTRGSAHGQSKLTEADVLTIREMRQSGMAIRKIAAKFGMTYTPIWEILSGKGWSHV